MTDGPWTKYQQQTAPSDGPWTKYGAQPDFSDVQGGATTAQQPRTVLQDLGRAATMTGRDVLQGALTIPEVLHDALIRAPYNAVASAFGSDSRIAPGAEQIDSLLNRAGVPNPQPENGVERVVGNIDKGLGSVIGGAGIGGALKTAASPAIQAAGNILTDKLGMQAVGAAAGPAAAGVAKESGVGPIGQAAYGLAGSMSPLAGAAVLEGGAHGARVLLGSPTPEATELAEKAIANGIPLKASQVGSSKIAKTVDSTTSQIPLSGAAKFQARQQDAFNQAVSRTIGENAPKVTPTVFNAAKQRLGKEFDRLVANADVPLSPDFLNTLRGHLQDANAFYGPDVAGRVGAIAKRLVTQAQNGVIPGRVMKDVDTNLGKVVGAGGPNAYPLGQLRESLRDAMEQNASPADVEAWANARQQYRDLKTIEPLVAKSTTGDISPAQLMGRVTANNAGKASMARGTRGDLGDLARIGQQFLKEPIADSGTARRVATFEFLKGLGTALAGFGAHNVIGTEPATLSLLGTLAASRGVQKALQGESMVNALLGNGNPWARIGQQVAPVANPTLTTQHELTSSGRR